VFKAVIKKNAVLRDVTPCSYCNNRRFGKGIASIISVARIGEQGTMSAATSNRSTLRKYYVSSALRLLDAANVRSSPILVTLMMEVIRSSETSVLTRATRLIIPGDGILQLLIGYYCCETDKLPFAWDYTPFVTEGRLCVKFEQEYRNWSTLHWGPKLLSFREPRPNILTAVK
jgi:hypothetical protein